MLSIEDFIISVFCCVDDLLKEINQVYPPRSKGFAPQLSDSEVITMEIVGEYFGIRPLAKLLPSYVLGIVLCKF